MMGIKTAIEWCDSTINPIMGCEGCELWNPEYSDEDQHCYAAALINRYSGNGKKGWPESFGKPEFFPGRIEKALKWPELNGTYRPGKPWLDGYPRIIFLNDLSDTFIEEPAPATWLSHRIIRAMEKSRHIWLFLTKRPKRMVSFFEDIGYIPRNFWLGITVTSSTKMHRVAELTEIRRITPNAKLWISAEPLLSAINAENYLINCDGCGNLGSSAYEIGYDAHMGSLCNSACIKNGEGPSIDWLVTGTESGPHRRPAELAWFRSLRDQCLGADVPFFLKQMDVDGKLIKMPELDGHIWNQMPEVA